MSSTTTAATHWRKSRQIGGRVRPIGRNKRRSPLPLSGITARDHTALRRPGRTHPRPTRNPLTKVGAGCVPTRGGGEGRGRAAASDDIPPPRSPKRDKGRIRHARRLVSEVGSIAGSVASRGEGREPHAAVHVASVSTNSRGAKEPECRRDRKQLPMLRIESNVHAANLVDVFGQWLSTVRIGMATPLGRATSRPIGRRQ